jgi:hypothetical protein
VIIIDWLRSFTCPLFSSICVYLHILLVPFAPLLPRRQGRRLRDSEPSSCPSKLGIYYFYQNYDFPNNCEDYIHRIGRTGVSLVAIDVERG